MNLRSLNTLHWALLASLAVHAVLLTVRFVAPESFNRVFKDTPLEVILVNSQSQEKSDKARALAQTSLAGGGDAQAGHATSPLPSALITDMGEAAQDQASRQLESLQEQQNLLLSDLKERIKALEVRDPQQTSNKPEQSAREEKHRQLLKMLAEIERRINMENARPKKRYISPATREEASAIYQDKVRRTIEDRGTSNFPQKGGQKLYGELTMIVTVNHDGRVLEAEVVRHSNNPTLDRQAQAIARQAGPFMAFTPAMRKEQDQLAMVFRFNFTHDATLQANITGMP